MPEVNIPGLGVIHFPDEMPPDQIAAHAKRLHDEERSFRQWYAPIARQQGLDPNPDAPEHHYNYRAAWKAGATPGTDGHWPSQFKAADHPNRYVDGQDTITGEEAPLTRERQAPGAPSALSAGHHPESAPQLFGKRIPTLRDVGAGDLPSDAAFLKRAPEVGGAAGMVLGGPVGAGLGAAGGSLVKGQFDRGAHMPTGGELGGAALEGGGALVLGGAPRALAAGARTIGPAIARHAKGLSNAASALSGIGTGIASGNPLTGMGMGAATKMLTSPSAIKSVGNLAGRAGAAVPAHAANKAGFGALTTASSADALRQALLDALGAESSTSAVP